MIKAWTSFWAGRTARRQEKLRRSQQFESSFSERLAERTDSSKIDVRCTSQPNVNSEDGEKPRRQTFSRFFQLWKGLRTSKRKSNSEEARRSVVFTIPTDDIFPKSQPQQQTQMFHSECSDHVVQMDGFVTHLCDVHRANEDAHGMKKDFKQIGQDVSALKNRDDALIEQRSNDELKEVNTSEIAVNTEEGTASIQKKKDDVYRTSSDDVVEFDTICRNTSPSATDGRDLENNGKTNYATCTSKESDVENDSGYGSSIHEIPCVESSTRFVRLNFESLGASRNERIANDDKCNSCPQARHNDTKHDTSNERHAKEQLKKPKVDDDVDSFQTLIQLAKLGMSHDALQASIENAEGNDNTGTTLLPSQDKTAETVDSSKVFQDDSPTSAIDHATAKNHSSEDGFHVKATEVNPSLHDTEGAPIAHHVDSVSGVILSCALSCEPNNGLSDVDGNPIPFNGSSRTSKAKTGEYQARKLKRRKQKQVSFESPPKDDDPSSETKTVARDATSGFFPETSDVIKMERKETFLSVESLILPQNKEYPLDNLKDSTTTEASSTRQHTQTTTSTSVERTSAGTKMYSLQAPSLESLHLPSEQSSDSKRTRSFSATIRRRFSFRSHQSLDDSDGGLGSSDHDVAAKSKQIKAFRSFRVNKRTKSTSNDSRNWNLECNEVNGYVSTFDRIFYEKTEETDFPDVPFTIPEVYD